MNEKYCLFGYGFVVDSVVVVELDVRQAGRVVDIRQLPSHPVQNIGNTNHYILDTDAIVFLKL
jgi:hypothetical protein